jgi:hypothetical protein
MSRHLDAGEDEEQAEEPHDPVKLHQQRPQRDEDGPEHQGAQDAVEEHAVLVLGRDPEVSQDQHEHEDVVDGQRVLDEIACQEFER